MIRYVKIHVVAIAGALAVAGAALLSPAMADDDETEAFTISRGGLLYDNWMAALEADKPTTTHPLWPSSNTKKKGAVTWRCKSCHGWDYKGVDGAYGKGSYKTGIKGLRNWVGKDPEGVVAVVRGAKHGYSKSVLSDSAVKKLGLFVTRGQLDMDQYIDRATSKARGDARRGARYYQTICAVCHGFNGKEINFKDEKTPEYVGTVSQHNPWEALHKIRNGQPGVAMVAMTALSIQDQVDLLAYCQTLPDK